ncbi:MAG: hypothetical protein FD167_436 [bacterium]|nr:MAG: hypothetical protein FD167_436 [bacterium]
MVIEKLSLTPAGTRECARRGIVRRLCQRQNAAHNSDSLTAIKIFIRNKRELLRSLNFMPYTSFVDSLALYCREIEHPTQKHQPLGW